MLRWSSKIVFCGFFKKFNFESSTISKIYKKKETLIEIRSCFNNNRKRQRLSKANHVDEALLKWFTGTLATDLPISGEILRAKAEKFANDLGDTSFKPSNGWLDRWKKRYNIVYKKLYWEKIDSDGPSVEIWLSSILFDISRRYKPDDIFNTDETGLYWRALPDGSHVFKSSQLEGGKIGKDRITVGLC